MAPQMRIYHEAIHGMRFFLTFVLIWLMQYSFATIDLPEYSTKEILIDKLVLAISEGKEGFGMV